jgi:protease-4
MISRIRNAFARLAAWWQRPRYEVDRLQQTGPLDQNTVLLALVKDLLVDRRATRRQKLATSLIYFLMIATPIVLYVWLYAQAVGLRSGPAAASTVGVVRIEGVISQDSMASADRVIPALRRAFESPRIKAVVLAIDSGGGSPVEAERIYRAVDAWKKETGKPVVAVIGNIGASAAYMIVLHADSIYAAQYSLIGSIGAVLQGWDFHRALDRLSVSQRVYASGNLKSMLNPFLPMSPEAEDKARALVQEMGEQFRAELDRMRAGKLKADVNYSSGEVWGGLEAQRVGVVDEIGTLDDVVKARWNAPIHDFGPRSPSMPFATAAADWLRTVFTVAADVPAALR